MIQGGTDIEKFILTITREFGSMGRSIARELSEILGVEFYDRDIVEEVSRQLNMPVAVISDKEEKAKHGFLPRMFPSGAEEEYIQNMILEAQKEITRDLAGKSSCILVGHCANFMLEQEKHAIHIFIYAPYEERLENRVNILETQEGEARRMILSVDKVRRAYHKKYAGYLSEDIGHKQPMVDSSLLGVTGMAEMTAGIVRSLYGG